MNKITFILCLVLAVILFQTISSAAVKTGEFVILDENVDAVLKYITKGSGTPKKVADAYAGKAALYVGGTGGDGQRYNDKVNRCDWDMSQASSAISGKLRFVKHHSLWFCRCS